MVLKVLGSVTPSGSDENLGTPTAVTSRDNPFSEGEISALFQQARTVEDESIPMIEPRGQSFGNLTSDDIQSSLKPRTDSVGSKLDANELGADHRSELGDSMMSDDDIASLFEQADQLAAPIPSTLTAVDIAGILAEDPLEAGKAGTPDSAVMMSDDEIAALMSAAAAEQEASFNLEAFSAAAANPIALKASQPTKPNSPRLKVVTSGVEVDFALAAKVPMELAVAALALPISIQPGKMVCHVAEPFDHEALAELSRSVGLLLETHSSTTDEVVVGLRTLYASEDTNRLERALINASGAKQSVTEWLIALYRRIA